MNSSNLQANDAVTLRSLKHYHRICLACAHAFDPLKDASNSYRCPRCRPCSTVASS